MQEDQPAADDALFHQAAFCGREIAVEQIVAQFVPQVLVQDVFPHGGKLFRAEFGAPQGRHLRLGGGHFLGRARHGLVGFRLVALAIPSLHLILLGTVRDGVVVDEALAIERFDKRKGFGVAGFAEGLDGGEAFDHELHRLRRVFIEQSADNLLQVIPVGRLNLPEEGVMVRVAEFGVLQPALGDTGWKNEPRRQFQPEIFAQVQRGLADQLPVFTHGQEQVSRFEFLNQGLRHQEVEGLRRFLNPNRLQPRGGEYGFSGRRPGCLFGQHAAADNGADQQHREAQEVWPELFHPLPHHSEQHIRDAQDEQGYLPVPVPLRDGLAGINQDCGRIDEAGADHGEERGAQTGSGVILLQRRHQTNNGDGAQAQQPCGFPK